MGEPVAVTTLMRLRSNLSGELAYNERRQARLRADLAHVNAVLRMLRGNDWEGVMARSAAAVVRQAGATRSGSQP